MHERTDKRKKDRKRFLTCEICKSRSFCNSGVKREFMTKFPLDEARCKEWVRRTGKEDLAYVPIEKLHALKYLCGQHFTPRDFNRKKSRLRRIAIPTLNLKYPPLSDDIMADFPLHLFQDSETEKTSQSEAHIMQARNIDPLRIVPSIASGNFQLPDSSSYEDFVHNLTYKENNENPLVQRICPNRRPIKMENCTENSTAVVTLDPLTKTPKLLIKPKTGVENIPKLVFDKRNIIDVTKLPMFRPTDLKSDCTFIQLKPQTKEEDVKEFPSNIDIQTIENDNSIVPVSRCEKILYEYLLKARSQLAQCKYVITKELFSLKVADNIVSNPELLATIEHVPSTQKLLTLIKPESRKKNTFSMKHKIKAVSILTKAPFGYSFLCKILWLPRSQTLVLLIKQAETIMSMVNSMYEEKVDTETIPL